MDYKKFVTFKIPSTSGINRGVFEQDSLGYVKIINRNWDKKPGIPFTRLLEYKALINHYTGKENWKKSTFALRCYNFIKMKNTIRGFDDPKKFLISRFSLMQIGNSNWIIYIHMHP